MSFIFLGSFGVSTFPDIIRMPRPSFSTRKVVQDFLLIVFTLHNKPNSA